MEATQEQLKQVELDFKAFAEQLFRNEYAPLPNSQIIELDLIDGGSERNDTTDFLYDLFTFGFQYKLNQNFRDHLSEEEFFLYINSYMRTIGFETILKDYTRNEQGEITNINIGFTMYTGE